MVAPAVPEYVAPIPVYVFPGCARMAIVPNGRQLQLRKLQEL
jgi:hypothetical protein